MMCRHYYFSPNLNDQNTQNGFLTELEETGASTNWCGVGKIAKRFDIKFIMQLFLDRRPGLGAHDNQANNIRGLSSRLLGTRLSFEAQLTTLKV